ncbi:hypothetical protein EXIGLDRAFT_726550 [Exidia glandulosa HHB12029]|uniref:Uncharacterized protein n=1 Tax=Exidia glandulosa HHB12029 TaxID=1314781 RepID=A0A165DPN3_EXIGL|nr:hypothetical protein EXIGLDRAFT_726550 [Exidia glandulosa HHB12029]
MEPRPSQTAKGRRAARCTAAEELGQADAAAFTFTQPFHQSSIRSANPYAHRVSEHAPGAASTSDHSPTRSSKPPLTARHRRRVWVSCGLGHPEDDDDLVLSFISDKLRAQRHPELARGSSPLPAGDEELIRLPMPTSSPSSPRRDVRPTRAAQPTMSSASFRVLSRRSLSRVIRRARSRARSSGTGTLPELSLPSPSRIARFHHSKRTHSTTTIPLRHSVLSPIPSSCTPFSTITNLAASVQTRSSVIQVRVELESDF